MHSCPHLGYLNYICNAYRDAVGTEYVGIAHALRLRHRRLRRLCRLCRRLCRRRRGYHVRVRLLIGETLVHMYSRAFSEHTRERTHTRSHVCTQVVDARVDDPSAPARCSGAIGFEPRVCTGLHAYAYAHASASMS